MELHAVSNRDKKIVLTPQILLRRQVPFCSLHASHSRAGGGQKEYRVLQLLPELSASSPPPTPSGRDFLAFPPLCHAGAASAGGRLLCHQLPAGGSRGCGARQRHPALQPGGGRIVFFLSLPPWPQKTQRFWTTSGWCRMRASARDHPQMWGRIGQLEGPEPETVRKGPRLPLGTADAGSLARAASM